MPRLVLFSGYSLVVLAVTVPFLSSPAFAADKIETVVVTASPFAGDKDRFATIVDSLDRDAILKTGASNLGDALNKVPGVTATGFAAGASRPVIRGFDANRVRLLEDGIGSFDVSDVGPDHAIPIDPLSAQKIEIVRGAATLRYGSQAIGGVVNVINNRVPLSLPNQLVSGELSGTYGSNADLNEASAIVDARFGQLAVHFDGFARQANNYQIPHGVQPNSFFNGDSYSVGGSYFIGENSRIGAAVIHSDAQYGIPSDTTFINMRQTKYLERSSFDLDAGVLQTLNIDAGYADYSHTEIDPTIGPLATFNDKEWDTRAEALFGKMGPFSSTALGVELQNREFEALGDARGYLLPTTTKTGAVFAFTEAPLGPTVQLQAGARVEHVDVSGTPASLVSTTVHFTPISGSVGVLWDASDILKFGLTVSSAARAPAQTELFAKGPHDGPGTYEVGDPTLGVERANSLEGTIRVKLHDVQLEGSLWGTSFKGFIYGQLTGGTCDEDGTCAPDDSLEFKQLNYQQQDARFWGLEGKATVSLGTVAGGDLGAEFLGDTVRAEFTNGGNVPRIPAYKVGAGMSWDSDDFDLDFMLFQVGRQNKLATAETPTKGYLDLDVGASWRPLQDQPSVQLSLVGHNLLDDVQRNAVSINKDAVILPGRDIRLILRVGF